MKRIFIFRLVMVGLFAPIDRDLKAHPLDHWNRHQGPIEDAWYRAVAYGNGQFVAVLRGGVVCVSKDGVDWEKRESGTTNDLKSVSYGNGVFVAVGWPDTLIASTDLVNWSTNLWDRGELFKVGRVKFVKDYFIMPIGVATSFYFKSADGITWRHKSVKMEPYIGGGLADMAYGDGLWVGVGSADRNWHYPCYENDPSFVIISRDETNWTAPRIQACELLESVTYNNGTFVAVGEQGTILSSKDGQSWSWVSAMGIGLGRYSLRKVAHGGGHFVAVGDHGKIISSSDGFNWRLCNSGVSNHLAGIAFGNGSFIVVGSRGTILQSDPIVELGIRRLHRAGNSGSEHDSLCELTLTGPVPRTYRIEAASDPTDANSWKPLATIVLTSAPFSWVDKESTNTLQRFYRAVLSP